MSSLTDHEAAAGDPCPGRGKHDREGRCQALVAAATHVFAVHGYDAATTREVAEHAGCSEGLIHRYFGGKRGLLLAVLEQRAGEVAEAFRQALPECRTVEEEIRAIIRAQIDAMWASREIMRVTVSQGAIDREAGKRIGELYHEARVHTIRQRLEDHRAAGRIDPSVDLDAIAYTLSGIGFSKGFMAQIVFARDRKEIERQADAFAAVVARGLAP